MVVIIDRFEGGFAVCEKEDRTMINIEKSRLPSGVKEGDSLIINDEGIFIFIPRDQDFHKEKIRCLMEELWK